MGIPVLLLGESGSGKSSSLRNFKPDEYLLLNVAGKPLPFRGKPKYAINKPDYLTLSKAISSSPTKVAVIDDSQYLMAFEFFDHAKETGYQKFTNLALNFKNLIDDVVKFAPEDEIVYFLHHVETTNEGKVKAKTIGKMLDEKLTIEGLFSIVLMCRTDGQRHYFETQSDGQTTAKSPMGMFEREIDNDLKFVDQTIREYWAITEKEKK
jgi:hypothetical protein